MASDTEKSPCFDCIIHQRCLDKLNPSYPCENCLKRIVYADSIYGPPARLTEEDVYYLYEDSLDFFYQFKDGMNLSY